MSIPNFSKTKFLIILSVFFGVLLFPSFSLAAIENFTTYTETDPNNVLNVAANTITVANLQRQSGAMVYKSFGAGYFGNSFEHLVSFQVDSMAGAYDVLFYPWTVSNTPSADSNSDPIIGVFVQSNSSSPAGNMYILLFSDDGIVDTSDFYNAGPGGWGTRYYLTITRNGTAVTAKIYNDAGRANLLDTLSITTGSSVYEYIYGAMSRGGTSADTTSGYIYDLDLQGAIDTTPPSTSIVSVEGDTTSPYTDTSDDGDTQILISGESGMLCRWYDSDTAYTASSGTICPVSGTQATCSVSTATGSYTKYVSCADSLGNGQTTANNLDVSWSVSIAPPSFDFNLSASPVSGTITQGGSVNITIGADLVSGTASPVSFSVSGLPAGATPSLSPASCTPTCSSALTISTTQTTAAGTYPLSITGTASSLSKTTSYSLTVNAAPVSGNETTIGSLSLAATYESISVYANFSGDSNSNNSASFRWRQSGGVWKQGMEMTVDRRATVVASGAYTYTNPYVNQWRASIIGVQPNTSYDVEVTFADANGVTGANPATQTIATRNDNILLGTGNAYYVSPSGVGATCANGTIFATIQQAANCANAGDTVYIRTGTYKEQVNIARSGTASNWITFLNSGSDVVTIDGENTRTRNITITASQYIRIKGLRLVNSSYDAINIDLNSSNIVIEDNYLAGFPNNGIKAGGTQNNPAQTANIVIQRNQILRSAPKASGAEGHMISFWRTQGGHIIRNNTIIADPAAFNGSLYFDCISGGSNFNFLVEGAPGPLDGSFNKDTDIYNNYAEGCPDDGIEIEGPAMNVRVWGNTLTRNNLGFGTAPIVIGPAYIFRNVIYNLDYAYTQLVGWKVDESGTGNLYIYHNTFYVPTLVGANGRSTTIAGWGSNSGSTNIKAKNNIFHVNSRIYDEMTSGGTGRTLGSGTNEVNYNLTYSERTATPYTEFAKWDGASSLTIEAFRTQTGQELNGIYGQASFIDAANGNFSLSAGSLGIDSGTALAGFNDANSLWPYRGTNPDIGAYEYDSGAPSFNFSLNAVPSSGAITQGQNITSTISLSLSAGSTQSVSLSASGLPSGATASFSPTSCNPTCSSTMTINTLVSAPVGTYPVTITGIAGATARTASYSLTVNASAPSSFTVSNVSPLYLLRDKATSALSITGSNFNLATNFTLGLSATSTYNFTVQAQTSSSFNVSLTTSQIGTAAIGLYDLILTRTTDSQSQTYSQKILITVLGDVSSPTAGQRDGKINIYDVSRLLSKWGSVLPADLAEADINSGPGNISQGRIDLYDANLLMRNWRP